MKKILLVAMLVWWSSATHNITHAEEVIEDGRWYFTPMGTYVVREDESRFTNGGPGIHLGLAKGIASNWALEFNFIGNELSGDDQHTIAQYGLGIDLIRTIETQGNWSPYLLLGTGYLKSDSNEDLAIPPVGIDSDNAIGSAAIGIARRLGSDKGLFRTELRYRADFGDETLGDLLFNIGLSVPIGVTAAAPVILDSDGDGVNDPDDLCPSTPANAAVDTNGCELDSDNDGVKNSRDRCANTASGVEVDSDGCEVIKVTDTDGDGIEDDKDQCPNTPAGTKVDSRGCKVIGDDDNDGVLNNIDECPNSAPGVRIDARGCEIKEEIRLPRVEFELNSATLTPASLSVLSGAADTLRKYPDITVEAEGHTDSSGAAAYNLRLSQQRAESVRDYIIGQGIAAPRITARGFGETAPIADNTTAAGRQSNRRVTLRLTSE